MSTAIPNRLILSFPSQILLDAKASDTNAPRSWIQLAKTGTFVSNRYGKFEISKADLSQMLHNFNNVTPQAPTELPIDFDHLSMDVKKPGDGIAAGWLKDLELREDGTELWGLAEWTPDAASMIAKRQYRFISPSFIKNHIHKDGSNIGTTLLASALTNHPFLENMASVTLADDPRVFGDVAMSLKEQPRPTVHHLAEIGQRLSFAADPTLTPELTDEERALTIIVKSTIGEGDDQVVRATTQDGTEFGWFSIRQLRVADAPDKQKNNPLPPNQTKEVQMSADTIKLANEFVTDVRRYEAMGKSTREAINLAQDDDKRRESKRAQAYLDHGRDGHGVGVEMQPEAETEPISLSTNTGGATFDDLAMQHAAKTGIPLRQAVREMAAKHPALAAAR